MNCYNDDMIRAVLLDIDGTLVNRERMITPRTLKTLKDAQSMGIRLCIASGRPDAGLYQWAKQLDMDHHHGILISYNGAKVLDCQTREILFHQAMSAEESRAVLEHIRQFDVFPP